MSDLAIRLERGAGGLATQLAVALRDAIRSGRLIAGTQLPASRELASDLEVSRGVVVDAYEQLVAEGFLVARQGSATLVADVGGSATTTDVAVERPAALPVRYDLRGGTPDLSAFPRAAWLAALRRALAALPHEELGYVDPGGVRRLRVELANYLSRVRAAEVNADHLVVLNGVSQGLNLTLRALAGSKTVELAVEDPSSGRCLSLLRSSGAVIVPVPVDEEGIDVRALRRTGARAVLLTPAHQCPTGVVLSPRRRAELVAWANEVDATIVEDDYDAEFRYDRDPVACLQALCPQRVVLLGSVSKSLAPGLRLGWLIGPPTVVEAARCGRQLGDLGSPVTEQHALAEFLASGGYERHLRTMRRRYRRRRDKLTEELARWMPDAMTHGVSAGLQLYLELPAGCDETKVIEVAAGKGVAVDGVAPLRLAQRGRPALLIGFAGTAEQHIPTAVRLIAESVRQSTSDCP